MTTQTEDDPVDEEQKQSLIDDEEAMKQIADLMNEKIYVRCMDRCPFGLRQIIYFIVTLIGVLIFLFIFLPFVSLLTAITACIWYHCCCQCCGNKPKGAPKFKTTKSKPCLYFSRAFTGDCRLCLIETPPEKRGCCWRALDIFIMGTGGLEYLFASAGGPASYVMHSLRLRNRYGDFYPNMHGISICDYHTAKKFLHSKKHTRGHTFQTVPIHKTFMRIGGLAPIFYSTGSKEHNEARQIIKAFLSDFQALHAGKNLGSLKEEIQNNLWDAVGLKKGEKNFSNITKDQIRVMVGTALFQLFLGTDFKFEADEQKALLGLFSLVPALLGAASWGHFLLGGFYFERATLERFLKIRKAFIRNKHKKQMIEFVKFCNEKQISVSEALNSITIIFIVAAFIGIDTPIWFGIEKFRSDAQMYVEQYNKDKYAFVKESVRVLGMKPGTTSYVLAEDIKLNIAEKERTIYKGTTMLIMTGQCNRDPEIFGGDEKTFEYANTFDPGRPNLDQILSWNGVEEFIMSKNEDVAPRQCPGHDVALFIITMIMDMMIKPDMNVQVT
eukprot:49349_1